MARFKGELGRVDVHAIALRRRLGSKCVTFDDLLGFGREGLLDAARTFDEKHGVPFAHWAALRIRSAMIDGVRKWGQLPRRAQRELHALEALDAVQFAHEGRPQPETAQAADQGLAKRLATMATAMALVNAEDEKVLVDPSASPEEMVAKAELRSLLREVIAQLPDRERKVVEGYYFAGLSLKEVGAKEGATESWACRVLGRATEAIHEELVKYGGVAFSEMRHSRKP
jgi:RNA polymerase sigma factor for flagellar operon FliA